MSGLMYAGPKAERPLSTLNGGTVISETTAAVDPKPTFARTFKGRPDVKSTIIVPNEAAIIS
jgi:hypothetical protein